MPRRNRLQSPTGYYHIMTRGINKDKIFKNTRDKAYLLRVISEKIDGSLCKIICYCIMDNHIHLLIEGDIDDLSLLMKKINISYAFYYNKINNRIGPVFQDRFKSEVIYDQVHFLGVLRYIHNNPVKAKMVFKAEEYRWSSMKEYVIEDIEIIHSESSAILNDNFKSINSFKEFHLSRDENIYLEVEEDYLLIKDKIGRRIVDKYLKELEKDSIDKLKNKDELIIKLLEKRFSYREIAKFVDCSLGKISKMNKIPRP